MPVLARDEVVGWGGHRSCRAAARVIADDFPVAERIIALARKIFRN